MTHSANKPCCTSKLILGRPSPDSLKLGDEFFTEGQSTSEDQIADHKLGMHMTEIQDELFVLPQAT